MCQVGLANLAIFYFHFGNTTKQDARNLLSSILFQLCSQSDKFSQILSSVYSSHGNGSREPSIDTLLDCLKTILTLRGQAPLYIIVDALDECPNSSGVRTQREEVLEILKELIDLKYPHLHLCVTSRPEIDIRRVFDPLNPYDVSLQNQVGQMRDLAEYVKSVVRSNVTMKNWPEKVKESVINTLAERGGGMYVVVVLALSILFSCDHFRFRWAYCQLETLRQCPLRYISSTLNELPKTLDETYERILRGIPEKMQKDAHRIFQWIMVSLEPLGVEELAEVFAINFDEEMCGIPVFEPSWRDTNAETAVLSACSTLVAIVNSREYGKIVQFSHFSVQEYLTSDRVAKSEHVSHFHIHPKPAHTLLAKACLSFLFHLDYSINDAKLNNFPLAMYASVNWVYHAQFEDVSSYIEDGIDLLFEKDKPHFATWIWVYDIERRIYPLSRDIRPEELDRDPLYYAALCGLRGLVERILTAHPQDLDPKAGAYSAPLNVALARGHLDIAQFLLDRGAVGDNMGEGRETGLYIASCRGYLDIVRSLIDRGADLNVRCNDWIMYSGDESWTPLHGAIHNDHPDIALFLLERGANPDIRSDRDQTPLYIASSRGHADVVRSLIDRRVDLNAASCEGRAPLHAAIQNNHRDIVLLLLEHGADLETRDWGDWTALHMASHCGRADIVGLLISHGADLNAECESLYLHGTPLHVASRSGRPEIARMLLEHGANPNALDHKGGTALHVTSEITVVELLFEYGVNVDVRDKEGFTPLHWAAKCIKLQVLGALLDHGADPRAQTNQGETPFQLANAPYQWTSKEDQQQIIQLLSERTGTRM